MCTLCAIEFLPNVRKTFVSNNNTDDINILQLKNQPDASSFHIVQQILLFSHTSIWLNIHLCLFVTRRVKKNMLSANTVLRYRPVKFVKYKENNRTKYAS